MPLNGDTFELLHDFVADRDQGEPESIIQAERMMEQLQDIADAFSSLLHHDGTNPVTENIDWGSNRILSLGAGEAQTDAATVLQAGGGLQRASETTAPDPGEWISTLAAPTPLPLHFEFTFAIPETNAGAVTLAVNGTAALPLRDIDGTAFPAGKLVTGRFARVIKLADQYRVLSGGAVPAPPGQAVTTEPLESVVGVAAGDTDLGAFDGTILTDGGSVKGALQELADAITNIELGNAATEDLEDALGVANGDSDLGAFPGSTISDNVSAKTALTELESALEGNIAATDSAFTLAGVAAGDEDLGTFTGSTIADASAIKPALQALETAVEEVNQDAADLATLTGVAENTTNLGTFTGATIADSRTIKAALQDLETALESSIGSIGSNTTALVTLSGVSAGATHLGTFPGTTIADSSTIKAALQSLETAVEEVNQDAADFATLSGVAENSVNLGTFTGGVISANQTIKQALQALATAVAEVNQDATDFASLSGVAENESNLGNFTGSTIGSGKTIKQALQALETAVQATFVPINSQSASYTAVLGDAQGAIFHPASDANNRTFTIPANSVVAFPVGTALTFINRINTVTIAINTDTLRWAGAGTTGSRTLIANGIATAIKITATEWMISGVGLE